MSSAPAVPLPAPLPAPLPPVLLSMLTSAGDEMTRQFRPLHPRTWSDVIVPPQENQTKTKPKPHKTKLKLSQTLHPSHKGAVQFSSRKSPAVAAQKPAEMSARVRIQKPTSHRPLCCDVVRVFFIFGCFNQPAPSRTNSASLSAASSMDMSTGGVKGASS